MVPRGVLMTARITAVAGMLAILAAALLLIFSVDAGSVHCGALTDAANWEYASNTRPIPADLAACEHPLSVRAAVLAFLARAGFVLLVIAAAAALAVRFIGASARGPRDRTTRLSG